MLAKPHEATGARLLAVLPQPHSIFPDKPHTAPVEQARICGIARHLFLHGGVNADPLKAVCPEPSDWPQANLFHHLQNQLASLLADGLALSARWRRNNG